MNNILAKEVAKLEDQALLYNYNILSLPTFAGDGVVFGNRDNGKAILLVLKDTPKYCVVKAFSINVHKWMWADREGFDSNAIIDEMGAEIFKHIPLEEALDYL